MARTRKARAFLYQSGYAPTWRGYPPHMSATEHAMWYRWLDAHPDQYDEIWYDVRVDGMPASEPLPAWYAEIEVPQEQRLYHALTSLRCDVIGS